MTNTQLLKHIDQTEEAEDFKFEMEVDEPLHMVFEEDEKEADPFHGFWGKLTHLITCQDHDAKLKHLCEMIKIAIALHSKKMGRRKR